MDTVTLTAAQITSETNAAMLTTMQETLYRGHRLTNYPAVMPAHHLTTCPQCDRPVTNARAAGYCSARCLTVAQVLVDL